MRSSWLRRRSTAALVAGATGSLALALSVNGTLSAFSAQITNSGNTAASGSLVMRETLLDASGNPTTTTCASNAPGLATNAATCAAINKYGGTTTPLTPGGAASTTAIAVANVGTVPATTFTLNPGACTATAQAINGGATDACSKFVVTIASGGRTIYTGPASSMPASVNVLSALGATSVAAGQSVPITVSVQLDRTADNTYAGFVVSQPLAWTFTA